VPRVVDHNQRRQDIAAAALACLAERGAEGLTIREVARRLGGSLTLVTHYYGSRQALLEDLAAQLEARWTADLANLESEVDTSRERLGTLLRWLVPTSERGRTEERARMALVTSQDSATFQRLLDYFESLIRRLIESHLQGLVPPQEVAATVDFLRVFANGIALATVEHPDSWTPDRQLAAVDWALSRVLPPAAPSTKSSRHKPTPSRKKE